MSLERGINWQLWPLETLVWKPSTQGPFAELTVLLSIFPLRCAHWLFAAAHSIMMSLSMIVLFSSVSLFTLVLHCPLSFSIFFLYGLSQNWPNRSYLPSCFPFKHFDPFPHLYLSCQNALRYWGPRRVLS